MRCGAMRCDGMRLGSAEEAADEPDFDSEAYGYTDSIRYHDHIRSQIAGLNEMKSPRATKAAASRAETAPSRGETAPSRAETAAPPAAVAGSHMEVLVKLGPKSVYHANRTLTNRVLPKVQLFNSLFEYVNTLLSAMRVCHRRLCTGWIEVGRSKASFYCFRTQNVRNSEFLSSCVTCVAQPPRPMHHMP
jgi:hypothetical protein